MTDEQIIVAYEAGETTTSLARRTGLSNQKIGRILKAVGVQMRVGGFVTTPAEERFRASYRVVESGCWLWSKAKAGGSRGRYGQIRHPDGSSTLAHRFSYQMHRGPVPDGMLVCHRCDVPLCVNPDHLFVGTPSDNMRDMIAKGRGRYQRAANKRAEMKL